MAESTASDTTASDTSASDAPVSGPRVVRAARGNQRTAKSWGAEAAKRMLMNNLDPEV
ncbi:hypothetical protein, partial [Microbacterium maritypicum]